MSTHIALTCNKALVVSLEHIAPLTYCTMTDSNTPAVDPPTVMDMETEAPSTTPAPGSAAYVTNETHEQLKRELAAEREKNARLVPKAEAFDSQKREFLSQVHGKAPDVMKHLESISNVDNRPYVEKLQSFAQTMHNVPAEKLDDSMPLALMIDCASAQLKRERDTTEHDGAKDQMLKDQLETIDGLRGDNDKLQKRCAEVVALADERGYANEELTQRLTQVAGTARRFDFSLKGSRETPSESTTAPASQVPLKMSTGGAGLIAQDMPSTGISTSLDVASRKAPMRAPMDPTASLAAYISQTGDSSGRIMRSSTAHDLLGGGGGSASSSMSMDTDLTAVVRASGNSRLR